MKIRRILCTILALIMVVGCFGAISVSADTLAEGGTVYLDATDGDDTKDGLTAANAVKTLNVAIGIINAAQDVENATIKIIGQYSTPTSNYTEPAHTATITYTGNDENAVLFFGRHYTMSGPVVYKNLKLDVGETRDTYIYYVNHKLVMDEGITVISTAGNGTDNANKTKGLQLVPAYGTAPVISGVDVTIKSGNYKLVAVADLNDCIVTGNVNLTIDGASTTVGTLYVGGNATGVNVVHTIKGKTTITVNNGTINNFFVGEGQASNLCVFRDLVHLKINGGRLGDANKFGVHANCNGNVIFSAKGCLVDFSEYKDQGDPTDGTNFYHSNKWKSMLNSNATDDAYKAPYKVTDATVVGMQVSEAVGNNKNVRFLVGLRGYNHVQTEIKVVAKWKQKDADATSYTQKSKTFKVGAVKVYDSIAANANGVNTAVTAESVGVNYLVALTITDIPYSTDLDIENETITFEVTPTTITNCGEPVVATTSTFTYTTVDAPSAS